MTFGDYILGVIAVIGTVLVAVGVWGWYDRHRFGSKDTFALKILVLAGAILIVLGVLGLSGQI